MTLIDTLVQPLRAQYTGKLDQHEQRRSQYGVYDMFKRQSASPQSIISSDLLAKIKASFGKTVTQTVFDAEDVTIGNVRRCTMADDENTSKLVTITFATYSFGFTMTPAQHYNNDIDYENDFRKKLEKYLIKFAATLDTACIAKLAADKSIYWPTAVSDVYTVTANALQVPNAGRADFYNQLASIMNVLDFYGEYDIAANTMHRPTVERLVNQGNANSANTAFQFPGFKWAYSNRLGNGSGVNSTLYVLPQGSVAIENRNDADSIMGSRVGEHKTWEEVQVPLVDLKMGAYYSKDCSDRSALNASTTGLTRSLVEGFEWSTDICLISSYNSTPSTKASAIVKAELLTA